MNTLYVNWNQFDDLVRQIGDQILAGFQADIIVGIERGGLIPSVYLSHRLGIRDFVSLPLRRTVNDTPFSEKQIPTISLLPNPKLQGKNILLVDDIISSGMTLNVARQYIQDSGATECRIAVIIDKSSERSTSVTLEYVGLEVSTWVVFPWERDNN